MIKKIYVLYMVKQNTLKEATEIPKFYIFESPYCKEDI
jgi:hypothetical protein